MLKLVLEESVKTLTLCHLKYISSKSILLIPKNLHNLDEIGLWLEWWMGDKLVARYSSYSQGVLKINMDGGRKRQDGKGMMSNLATFRSNMFVIRSGSLSQVSNCRTQM